MTSARLKQRSTNAWLAGERLTDGGTPGTATTQLSVMQRRDSDYSYMVPPTATIIIPAHNEERTIARILALLCQPSPPANVDVVVVVNGASDTTAEVARKFENITVLETPQASKTAALNLGLSKVEDGVLIFVDADVTIDTTSILALARNVDLTVPVIASPRMEVDLSRSSLAVRMYYRIWEQTNYRRKSPIGAGVFAVSAPGGVRIDPFPDLIADHLWAMNQFSETERAFPSDATFLVFPPRDVRSQILRLSRAMLGEAEAKTAPGATLNKRSSFSLSNDKIALLRRVAKMPLLWPSFIVYASVYGLANCRMQIMRRRSTWAWEFDASSRQM